MNTSETPKNTEVSNLAQIGTLELPNVITRAIKKVSDEIATADVIELKQQFELMRCPTVCSANRCAAADAIVSNLLNGLEHSERFQYGIQSVPLETACCSTGHDAIKLNIVYARNNLN